MSKVRKYNRTKKVHSHKFNFLPVHYVNLILKKLQQEGLYFSYDAIRSVKNGRRANPKILLALLELDAEYKKINSDIHKLTKNQ